MNKVLRILRVILIFSFIGNLFSAEPNGRSAPTLTNIGNEEVIQFGGDLNNTQLNDLWKFSIVNDVETWEELTPGGITVPGITEHAAVFYNNEIYIIGGITSEIGYNEEANIQIFKYSVSENSWSNVEFSGIEIPKQMSSHVAELIGDKIYINYQEQTWSFDLTNNNWTRLADAPTYDPSKYNHQWHAAGIWENKLVIFRNGIQSNGEVQLYNTLDDTWEEVIPAPDTTVSNSLNKTTNNPGVPRGAWSSSYWQNGENFYTGSGRETSGPGLHEEFWKLNIVDMRWEKLLSITDIRYHGYAEPISETKILITGGSEPEGSEIKYKEYKVIEIEQPNQGFDLITSVSPPEAVKDKCMATPAYQHFEWPGYTMLTAVPKDGWVFSGWTGDITSMLNPVEVLVMDDMEVIANFKPTLTIGLSSEPAKSHAVPEPGGRIYIGTAGLTAHAVDWMLKGLVFVPPFGISSVKAEYTEAYLQIIGKTHPIKGTITKDEDGNISDIKFSMNEVIKEGETLRAQFYYIFNFPKNDEGLYSPLEKVRQYAISYNYTMVNAQPIPVPTGVILPDETFKTEIQTVASIWNVSHTPHLPYVSLYDAVEDSISNNGDNIEIWEGFYKVDKTSKIEKSLNIKGVGNINNIIFQMKDFDNEDPILMINHNDVNIENLCFKNSQKVIEIYKDKINLSNLKVVNNFNCIFIEKSKNITIDESTFDGNNICISVSKECKDITIKNSIFLNSVAALTDKTIEIEKPENLKIHDCIFRDNDHEVLGISGITKNSIIFNNIFEGKGSYVGLKLWNTENMIISSNEFTGDYSHHISIRYGKNNHILNNYFTDSNPNSNGTPTNSIDGLGAKSVYIKYNTFKKIWSTINFNESTDININNNKFYKIGSGSGITISNSQKIDISKNLIDGILNFSSFWPQRGIWISKCKGFNIAHNRIYDIGGEWISNLKGILIEESSYGSIFGNILFRNCTGLYLRDCKDGKISIRENRIQNCFCFFTGMNLADFNGEIKNNVFINNKGAGIRLAGESLPKIISSNNFDANEFAVINSTELPLDMNDNYWGSESGPAIDDYQGMVNVDSWLKKPVSIVISTGIDTLNLGVGSKDTINVGVHNFQKMDDQVLIEILDDNDWITSNKSHDITLVDSLVSTIPISFSIPSDAGNNFSNKVFISATSQTDQTMFAVDSFYIMNYVPELEELIISPDSVTVGFGDSLNFGFTALDQNDNLWNGDLDIQWLVSSGTIDTNGFYVCDSIPQNIEITATDLISGLSDKASISISPHKNFAEIVTIYPDSLTLLPGEEMRFQALGFNHDGFSIEFEQQWTAVGGMVDSVGNYIASENPGFYEVTVIDKNTQANATAYITVRGETAIDDEIIPASYSLNQNYPNPFNPTTTITYSLPFDSNVRIEIYNMLGQRVESLKNEIQHIGYYQLNWNADNYATGIYLLKMRAISMTNSEIFTDTKKMVLLK